IVNIMTETVDCLLNALGTRDYDSIESIWEKLDKQDIDKSLPDLLNVIATGRDIYVREQISILLGDMGIEMLVPIVFDIVNSSPPDVSISTFLYSIRNLDYRLYFKDLISISINRGEGAREEALDLVCSKHEWFTSDKQIRYVQECIRACRDRELMDIADDLECLLELLRSR
ncbi:hypothetical protein KKF84_15555, partial [Myxococcota bacterium]|nr:hypothetical protein [Myxococcota bacterium]